MGSGAGAGSGTEAGSGAGAVPGAEAGSGAGVGSGVGVGSGAGAVSGAGAEFGVGAGECADGDVGGAGGLGLMNKSFFGRGYSRRRPRNNAARLVSSTIPPLLNTTGPIVESVFPTLAARCYRG